MAGTVVAPFLISQCYNYKEPNRDVVQVVAPFLISQCYNVCLCGKPVR